MAVKERRKGMVGQQEVTRLFAAYGHTLDKLAAQGDRVWYGPNDYSLRLEVKNHTERTRLPAWIAQSILETPATMTPAVVWKLGGRWRFDIDLEDLLKILRG